MKDKEGFPVISRATHLQWCKDRAYEYLDNNDVPQAWASFASNMSKHEETANHMALNMGTAIILAGHYKSVDDMRHFIEGFN